MFNVKTQEMDTGLYDVACMELHRILPEIEGDILEIGAFIGGGTARLAEIAQTYQRQVHVIDIFDSDFDRSINEGGVKLSDFYKEALQEKDAPIRCYRACID